MASLDFQFGNDAGLEMMVLSLGGLAGGSAQSKADGELGSGNADLVEPVLSGGSGFGGLLVLSSKV
jgi:hypothetical protein